MGAAEIRTAVLKLGEDVLGSQFSVKIISEKESTLEVRCEATTGAILYEMDSKIMFSILNWCEKEDIDFSVEEMEAMTPDMDDYV
jgi:hypothetical protein